MASNVIEYFGMETVEKAVANYFAQHGVTEEVRDRLMIMEIEDSDEFFQMVENFIEKSV
jgi:trehalose/maltose hydrolase-like predicted phosphorylase